MQQTPREVIVAHLAFMAFWISLVAVILIAARLSSRARDFRERMLAQWQSALAIAVLAWLSVALSGRGLLNPYMLAIFCQAMIGLALARSITGFEPLPVARSVVQRERAWFVNVALMIVIALVIVFPALIIGGIGMSIWQRVFGESNFTREAQNMLQYNVWQAFFALLWGAGIAEETVYRLVAVSLVWRWTGRAWLGIVVGALLFGAYHLSPLSGMYLTFWKFPISQFLGSAFIGSVWGFLYVKRGYETAVLAHTFQNWIPLVLSVLLSR